MLSILRNLCWVDQQHWKQALKPMNLGPAGYFCWGQSEMTVEGNPKWPHLCASVCSVINSCVCMCVHIYIYMYIYMYTIKYMHMNMCTYFTLYTVYSRPMSIDWLRACQVLRERDVLEQQTTCWACEGPVFLSIFLSIVYIYTHT